MNRGRIVRIGRTWLAALVLLVVVLCGVTSVAEASSGTIKVSTKSCEKGDTVSVTVTVSGNAVIAGYDFYLEYDAKVLEYVSGADGGGNGRLHFQYVEMDLDVNKKEYSVTVKFKGIAVGSSTLSVKDYEVYNLDPNDGGNYMDITASAGKVTVNAPYEASTNAQLSSLKVGEGTLSPSFSKNTYEYTMSVGGGVDSLTVSAKAADSKAKVSVTGNKDLVEGANTVKVKVTAEDGKTTKTYTIVVTRGKPSPTPTPTPGVTVNVGGTDLTLSDTITGEIPEGYEAGTMEYEGHTVATLQSLAGDVTLVELSDGAFYIWNAEDGSVYPFREVKEDARSYTLLAVPADVAVPEGYTASTANVVGVETEVYRVSEDSECVLVYAMNWDGEKGWYSYDTKEASIQRFLTEEPEDVPVVQPDVTVTVVPTLTPTAIPTGVPAGDSNGGADEENSDGNGLLYWILILVFFLTTVIFLVLYLSERNKHVEEVPVDMDDADDLPGYMSLRPEPEEESMESFIEQQKANRARMQKLAEDAEKMQGLAEQAQKDIDEADEWL